MDNQTKQKLNLINWDFSDYNSAKYPLDLNSIHWYLATFPPMIPMYLISLLSKEGDLILDPFGGGGTTAIKAIELNRCFIYNDINPFAVDIVKSKIDILYSYFDCPNFLVNEDTLIERYLVDEQSVDEFILINNLDANIKSWYEIKTLSELCSIYNMIFSDRNANRIEESIRRCAFSSILKAVCSQTDHITYITDNCKPKKLVYKNARKQYLDQIRIIRLSVDDFYKRYISIFGSDESVKRNLDNSIVNSGDSRDMKWIKANSVDLIVTSPPYLCAQDYVKTMRLTHMFFPSEFMKEKLSLEIGARRKRGANAEKTVHEYYVDMECVIAEIARVLKVGKYFCLVLGQGSGRTTKAYDTVADISKLIQDKYGFTLEHEAQRNIWSRRIHLGGVSEESLLIFMKTDTGVHDNGR
ncbi:MAG: site-specific DNA-methyltransferase [Clostridiales bacterium]|nr:site-specific DNA-methyltransferase [Clostridiales bacterium]